MKKAALLAVIAALTLSPDAASADNDRRNDNVYRHHQSSRDISAREIVMVLREALRDYDRNNPYPSGLARRGELSRDYTRYNGLPPGKTARYGLPDGLERLMEARLEQRFSGNDFEVQGWNVLRYDPRRRVLREVYIDLVEAAAEDYDDKWGYFHRGRGFGS
jgi:hypothetical protein